MWSALVVAILALAALLVFILQNPGSVEVNFLMFQGSLPLAIALLFAMMLGAVVVLACGTARMLQLRGVVRRARRLNAQTAPPVETSGTPEDSEAAPPLAKPAVQ